MLLTNRNRSTVFWCFLLNIINSLMFLKEVCWVITFTWTVKLICFSLKQWATDWVYRALYQFIMKLSRAACLRHFSLCITNHRSNYEKTMNDLNRGGIKYEFIASYLVIFSASFFKHNINDYNFQNSKPLRSQNFFKSCYKKKSLMFLKITYWKIFYWKSNLENVNAFH